MAEADFDDAPTTTGTPTTAPKLQLLDTQPDGYCDPVTGVCMLPGATTGEPTDQPPEETTVTQAATDASDAPGHTDR